jgi:hypothetical protein
MGDTCVSQLVDKGANEQVQEMTGSQVCLLFNAHNIGLNFKQDSAYSRSGSDPATIPQPAKSRAS